MRCFADQSPDHIIKVNVYLTNMVDFAAMNAVYATQFEKSYPARTTIGVASLPLGARIEIDRPAGRNSLSFQESGGG